MTDIIKKPRTSYAKVAVVGPTGTGKSYLSKTADKQHTGYINSENKPFPYKADPFKYIGTPKNWAGYIKNLEDFGKNDDIHNIIIDSQTMAFQILNAEMQRQYSGWDVAGNYNKKLYDYFILLKDIQKDIIVFSHEDQVMIKGDGYKKRMFVHNKQYEGKVEEQFTIVLYTGTRLVNGKPTYFLKTFEEDTSTKVSEGLFPDKDGNTRLEIPNDAAYIFKNVEDYYS